jgi:hypothetical protein
MRVVHSHGAHMLPSSSFDSVGGIVDQLLMEYCFSCLCL